ncbi:MAG TPA: 1-acyl-sn-glycerol-3-phosphate acyltransferase [Deltaproteobacteria bacterium]|nr:1-acyl-sn-glycerol-3-phosphate acyltransferase [Deltaproteobacteria bacterium]
MFWRSVFANLYAFILTPLLSVVCLMAALLGDQRGVIWWPIARYWAKGLLKIGGATKVVIHGREKLDKIHSAIFMANHESQLDPPLMTYLTEKSPLRFFAKHTLAYFPLFGQALWATGQVLINRNKAGKALKSIEKTIARIKNEDKYFFIFPEGKRSRDGKLLPFKKGGFMLALRTKLPILPIAITGTKDILPPGFIFRRKGPIVIAVGDLIPAAAYDSKSYKQLISLVRGQVEELQKKARKVYEKISTL